jgi:hypothetical protein
MEWMGALSPQRAHALVILGKSEVEHRGLECLGLLLQFLASGFPGRAEGLADVGEVAERDSGLLSHRSWCR